MGWAAAIPAVIGAVGKYDSDQKAGRADKKSREAAGKAMDIWNGLDIPDIEKQKILLENPELVGLLEAEELGSSAMDEISLDPKMRDAQMKALSMLQEEGETGMSVEDKMAQNELRRSADAQAQAEQKSILSGMAQRGTLDSGAQLAAQLGAQQGSAQRRSEGADRLAADASSRRKQALMQSSNLASQMEGTDFNRQSQQAQAKDLINKFNVNNRQNVAAQNLAARQMQENQRAGLANQQQIHNKALQQQQFQNEATKAAGQTSQYNSAAANASQQAGAKAQAGADMFGAGIGAAATMYSDKRLKENIEPASYELQELLDKLNASRYTYKEGNELPKGHQVGVMAQDLEKSPLGASFVEEDEEGNKMVNYGAMGSTQMAALADIHARVKELELKKEGEE